MKTIRFENNYEILQDVYGTAEERGITNPDFDPAFTGIVHDISCYEPLPHLGHLQTVFEEQPYFGRNLRFYNAAPWWYRLRFTVSADGFKHAVIRIGAADYYADVYLNGIKLGSHSGYFHSFEFDADGAIKRDGSENVLLIKVSSPWDKENTALGGRCGGIERGMIKGTYEHADPFGSRDLNPVGLLLPAEIDLFDGNRISGVSVRTEYDPEKKNGKIIADVKTDREDAKIRLTVTDKQTGIRVYTAESDNGKFDEALEKVKCWTVYERGIPCLYKLTFELIEDGKPIQKVVRTVGFRTVELRRTPEKAEYYLNGERFYIRGTSYFPNFYTSKITPARIRRDIATMKSVGINFIRVHVHAEIPEFYEICDEEGMPVMQDDDLNWMFRNDEEFLPEIIGNWAELIDYCAYHPCVCTLVCVNEPLFPEYYDVRPAPQMEEYAAKVVPDMPIIRGSGKDVSVKSADTHNYTGSLFTHLPDSYLDNTIRDTEKLNTEFGMDCPAELESLRSIPKLYNMLSMSKEKYEELNNYQYRFLKYYIEEYRVRKYAPCAGYIQFLFTDPIPESFFGVIDFWGMPKGGLNAMKESGGKYCAIFEHDTKPKALWAINDTLKEIKAVLTAVLCDAEENEKSTDSYSVTVAPDSSLRICDYTNVAEGDKLYLTLVSEDGEVLARNHYDDPLVQPPHPEGHPYFINCEFCMHFYRDLNKNK